MVTASIIRERIRRLFRIAAADSVTPDSLLDTLSDAAQDALDANQTVISISHQEGSMGFATFQGWSPARALEMVDICRQFIEAYPLSDYADADAQLAAILASIRTVRRTRPDFSGLRS